jgi:hypothetical protein
MNDQHPGLLMHSDGCPPCGQEPPALSAATSQGEGEGYPRVDRYGSTSGPGMLVQHGVHGMFDKRNGPQARARGKPATKRLHSEACW